MLVIIFVLAVSFILFFPGIDTGSFTPGTSSRSFASETRGAAQGGELLLQDSNGWRAEEPALVDPEAEDEEEAGAYQPALEVDDPLIKRIADLRTKLSENYLVE